MSDLNIYQRINEVMKQVKYVKKDKAVGKGDYGYMAVTHDAITALVREHIVEVGIVLTIRQVSQAFDEREQGAKMRMYNGEYCIRFTNIDKPEEFIEITVFSQALDNGDKAPGKAMSYATKYAILKTFMIETGENEESRSFDPTQEVISSTEILELQNLLNEAGKTQEYLIEYLNKKGAQIVSLDQLIESTFQYSKSLLLNAIKKENESAD